MCGGEVVVYSTCLVVFTPNASILEKQSDEADYDTDTDITKGNNGGSGDRHIFSPLGEVGQF